MSEKLQKSEDPEFETDEGKDDNFIKISGVIERKIEQKNPPDEIRAFRLICPQCNEIIMKNQPKKKISGIFCPSCKAFLKFDGTPN